MSEMFAKKIQKRMGEAFEDKEMLGGFWQGRSYLHILKSEVANFIDGKQQKYCNVKGNKFAEKIKYHTGAAHLNSSQVMCINFFKKFFEKPENEKYLLELLQECGIAINGKIIENAIFEYKPKGKEGTNFDFYLEFTDGSKCTLEIKYTEPEFGGITLDKNDPDKYRKKWGAIYKKMVAESKFLACNEKAFYANYQVNRNIVYANEGDYVVFLTPQANDAEQLRKGREYINDIHKNYNNIMNLYWEDVVPKLLTLVEENEELLRYYQKFTKKYIDVLTDVKRTVEGEDMMLFRNSVRKTTIDKNGHVECSVTFKWELFKDKETINYRNMDDYLANIWLLAGAIRNDSKNGSEMLYDPKYYSTQKQHVPDHSGCTPFGLGDDGTRVTEKRMCKCMHYFGDNPELCQNCQLERKWKNVGAIKILDYEVPTKFVVESVGGIDLLLETEDGTRYSTEVKPAGSKESLVRMMAEAYTMVAVGEKYTPAICFFKESQQCRDFCNPQIYHDTAFQYLLSKIKVFYITTKEVDGVVEFVIHEHDKEPLM